MSTALQDLPDPLQPPPALPSSSPDDLLAKMADEAIDQLMAGAEKGAEPPPRMLSEEELDAADAAADARNAYEPLSEKEKAKPAVVEETPIAETPVAVPLPEPVETPVEPAVHEPVVESHADDAAAPPADHAKAMLLESSASHPSASASPLLWPLRIINAPFAWLGDGGRMFMGLLAIVTLVPAACAIVYVLWMKGR